MGPASAPNPKEVMNPVRDAAGQIDIQGKMQAVTSVIEGWIREYPISGCGYTVTGGSACSTPGPHPGHTVQLGYAAVNLTDHALRERPEVHVQRHQHDDITQRSWIGLGDLDEGLPERLANLRQGPHDLVYAVDAAKPLAHVAFW